MRTSGTVALGLRRVEKNACPKRLAAAAPQGPGGRAESQCTTCATPASRRLRAAARTVNAGVARARICLKRHENTPTEKKLHPQSAPLLSTVQEPAPGPANPAPSRRARHGLQHQNRAA